MVKKKCVLYSEFYGTLTLLNESVVVILVCKHVERDSVYWQAKKSYEKAFREAQKAQEAYKRAEQDINLSKADVERVFLYPRIFSAFVETWL